MELPRFKPVVGFSTYIAPTMPESYRDKIEDSLQSDMDKTEYKPLDLMDAIDERQFYPFAHDGSGNWARAWRQFNVAEGLYRMSVLNQYEDVEGFDAMSHPIMESIPLMDRYRFINVGSEAELLKKIEWWKADTEDMQMLMSGPSLYPILTASLASPTTVAPLAPAKFLRASSVWKRFAGGAIFTGAILAPEEMLMAETIQSRDAGHAALSITAGSLLGGTLSMALGGPRKKILSGGNDTSVQIYREGGSSVNAERARETAYHTMDGDALAETGIGIEKMSWNPTIRLLKSMNPLSRRVVAKIVDLGGMIQKKVRSEEAVEQSVETTFRTRWIPGLLNSIRSIDEAYLGYRNIVPKKGDISRSLQMLRTQAMDMFGRRQGFMTQAEFRVRVSQAMRRGDNDIVDDSATSFVNQAAKSTRKHFDDIKNEATNVRLFERQAQKVISALQKQIDEAISDSSKAALQQKLVKAQEYLQQIRTSGVNVNTAISYLPRIIRVDKVLANQDQWMRIMIAEGRRQGMSDVAAKKWAKDSLDTAIHNRPWFDVDNASEIDWITQASSTKARTLNVPDELIEDFLESDVEVLLRHHTKTMGTDIELQRTFGDISMNNIIDDVISEYQTLIRATDDLEKRGSLKKAMENDIRDIKGLRDRLRGTYGASKDPHQMSSRFVRAMKSFNVLVGMGSATISSIPDLGRTVMTEGLLNFYEKGLRNLFKNSDSILKKMTKKEINQAGIAADAILGLRASAFSDIGDLFGSRMSFERGLNKSTGIFFLMNGLNYWNQAMKSFAGNVIMMRMTETITKPWTSLTRIEKEKLLKNGIDQQMSSRIEMQIRNHGEQVDGEWMPNTELWTDSTARMSFRNALNQSVDRTIVTPGAGDRALWTSTELGSLITQFKGYGQGAMVRVLTSGLQEKDQAFWQGAFLMVGLAYFVNEAKKVQYGIDKKDNFMEGLINAVDRSGTLGWFTDINNSLEKISDYKLGIRSVFGQNVPKKMPFGQKIGAMAGPTASNIATLGGFTSDLLSGNLNQGSMKSLRFVTPGGNLPYLDPIYDGVFGQ